MEIGGKETSVWWDLLRVRAERWSGRRTFVVAAALLFALLDVTGAVSTWVAFVSVVVLTVIVITHSLLLGETVGRIRVSPPAPQGGFAGLASGAGRTILIEMPDPVVVLDSGGRIIFCNRAGERLIGPHANGKHVATMLRSAALMTAIDEVLQGGEAQTVNYAQPVPVERNYTAFITPIETDALDGSETLDPLKRKRSRAVLVVLRDVTEARRVEDMRVDFVAFASHELKTPLASLSGFIDTLRGHAKDDPEAQERFLAIMADQAARMRNLIEDLLSLSRIELREHVRPHKIVDMLAVVSDVTDGLAHVAEKNGMDLTVTSSATLPRVKGEAEELGQVVQNLVDNALRYGRSGKRVEVDLAPDTRGGKPMLRISVRDYGEGISREHLPRLTERFYRVDAAASRAKGGTGLGLAIVKHIVNRHEGTLTIDSELGEGATFTVLIPAVAEEIAV